MRFKKGSHVTQQAKSELLKRFPSSEASLMVFRHFFECLIEKS